MLFMSLSTTFHKIRRIYFISPHACTRMQQTHPHTLSLTDSPTTQYYTYLPTLHAAFFDLTHLSTTCNLAHIFSDFFTNSFHFLYDLYHISLLCISITFSNLTFFLLIAFACHHRYKNPLFKYAQQLAFNHHNKTHNIVDYFSYLSYRKTFFFINLHALFLSIL